MHLSRDYVLNSLYKPAMREEKFEKLCIEYRTKGCLDCLALTYLKEAIVYEDILNKYCDGYPKEEVHLC